jgi:tetratricopeptide (TPR) repeat protein
MAPVNTVAMRHFLAALDSMNHHNWTWALGGLAQAESLQRDTSARVFRGEIWGERATCLMFMHNPRESEYWARRGLTLWHENLYAHFALGALAYEDGNFDEAAVELDSALSLNVAFNAAKELRRLVRAEIRARDSTRADQQRR